MSVLENPPHTIRIFTAETVADTYGNPLIRLSSESVEVRALVSPVPSEVRQRPEDRPARRYKLMVRDAPISLVSRVIWNNQSYTVESVMTHDSSDATRHVEAVLREER
jgi:hypothetical protein